MATDLPRDFPIRAVATTAFLAILTLASPVQASEPGYQVQVGLAESDNIQRLPTGGRDETIAFEELGFTWHDKRPWLDADIDADVSRLDYLQSTYSGEFIGNILGGARIKISPDILTWDIDENFGQTRLDPLAPITPANRENVNYLNTGPEVSLPLGQTTQLDLIGQYGRVDYETSPLDSQRFTGAIGVVHQLSATSSFSLNAKDERIDFQNDQLNPDYDRQEAFGRFDAKGSRTQLGVDLGYSRLQIDGDHIGSLLARLELARRLSADSTLGFAVGHDYSDGADSFRLVQTLGGATLNTQSTVQSGEPFVGNYATVGWNFQRARTTLDLSANYFRDRYVRDSTLDNDRWAINGSATRQVTPQIQLGLGEYVIHQRFLNGGDATESNTGLTFTWRVGRHLSVFAAYYYSKSTGDIPANEYSENRLWVAIGYGRAAEVPPGPAPLRLPTQQ